MNFGIVFKIFFEELIAFVVTPLYMLLQCLLTCGGNCRGVGPVKLRLCMIPADITFVALFPLNHWLFIEKIVLDDSTISELEKP